MINPYRRIFWVFPSLYACAVWFEMFDLRGMISSNILLTQPEGVSGLRVVDLASLKFPMQDLDANAALSSSYAHPSPPMPGYVPLTASHVV